MDAAFFTIVQITFVGGMIYAANQQRTMLMRLLLYGMLLTLMLLGQSVLMIGLFNEMEQFELRASQGDMFFAAGVSIVSAFAGLALVQSEGTRTWFASGVARLGGTLNPHSDVHLVAAVMLICTLAYTMFNFALGGGSAGYEQTIQEQGISPTSPLLDATLFILLALLGVGFAIRRSGEETLARLGLRAPTRGDLISGIGVGTALFGWQLICGSILISLFPQLAQDGSSEVIVNTFSTLPLAFLLSACAAFGEEILIRGALQPVFGILISSIFFTMLHQQYFFSPLLLILFSVSLGLAWLRRTQSTTACIVAHFIYNFLQLALVLVIQ